MLMALDLFVNEGKIWSSISRKQKVVAGFMADLFHKGMLWELAGRYCTIRGAFSSAIHPGFVLPFQGWRAWGFEEEEGCDRIAVDGTLWRAVSDPRRLCLYCPFLTMFFRPSSLTVYVDSLWGVFEACEKWPRLKVEGNPGSSELLEPWWHFCICGCLRSWTHNSQCGAAEQMILHTITSLAVQDSSKPWQDGRGTGC